jgi:hypothetical protein
MVLLNTFSFLISYLLFLIFLRFANIYLWVHDSLSADRVFNRDSKNGN